MGQLCKFPEARVCAQAHHLSHICSKRHPRDPKGLPSAQQEPKTTPKGSSDSNKTNQISSQLRQPLHRHNYQTTLRRNWSRSCGMRGALEHRKHHANGKFFSTVVNKSNIPRHVEYKTKSAALTRTPPRNSELERGEDVVKTPRCHKSPI